MKNCINIIEKKFKDPESYYSLIASYVQTEEAVLVISTNNNLTLDLLEEAINKYLVCEECDKSLYLHIKKDQNFEKHSFNLLNTCKIKPTIIFIDNVKENIERYEEILHMLKLNNKDELKKVIFVIQTKEDK